METPRSVDLAITSRCNLNCAYCSHFTGPGDVHKDLPVNIWERFFEKLKACTVLNVTLQGGEPFVRKDLLNIIENIVRSRMRFTILTNGTLVTEENAKFIADTGRCDTIQVSLDGAGPDAHDSARGSGTFKTAVAGIKILCRYGVPVSVRVTIHRHNVHCLREIAKFLLEDFGFPSFSTNSAAYLGRCRENADDIRLTVDEHAEAMAVLLELRRRYDGRINASAGPLADGLTWVAMEKWRKERREKVNGKGCLTSCGGVFSKLAVRSDGVMVPCTQMSHIELGRILEDDLKKVWQNHPKLMDLRRRREIPLTDFDFCRNCVYIPYCSGGCPAEAFTSVGDEYHPSPDSCLKRFFENGGTLPRGVD